MTKRTIHFLLFFFSIRIPPLFVSKVTLKEVFFNTFGTNNNYLERTALFSFLSPDSLCKRRNNLVQVSDHAVTNQIQKVILIYNISPDIKLKLCALVGPIVIQVKM